VRRWTSSPDRKKLANSRCEFFCRRNRYTRGRSASPQPCAEAVFVGSGIFKSSDPEARAKAIVKATTHFEDAKAVLEASEELAKPCRLDVRQLEQKDLLSTRAGKFRKYFTPLQVFRATRWQTAFDCQL